MICSEFFKLLDNYENLTESEKSELNSHSAECDACRNEYEFFKSITSAVSALPCPEPPVDLIAKVNEKLDSEPIVTRRFRVAQSMKRNAYRYATVAACLALGLVVGLNNRKIKDNLVNSNTDGVISVTTVTEKKAEDKPVEQEVASTTAPTETPVEIKTETVKPQATQKPVVKKTSKPVQKPVKKVESVTTTAPVTPVPTVKPVPVKATAEPVIEVEATETPVNTELSTAAPQTEQTYTIAKEEYHIPETQTASATETPNNISDYSLDANKSRIAIGYYDIPDTKQKKHEEGFSNKLIVSVNDVGYITTHMSKLGAMNSGKGYQMSLANFYELLMILDEQKVSYRYSSGINEDDTIVFAIVTY